MTAVVAAPAGFPLWAVRHARLFLVVMLVPFAAVSPLFMFTRHPNMSAVSRTIVVVSALTAMGLQLRHSFAAGRGERPRAWPLTFAVVCACAFGPLWWFGLDWDTVQWFVIASAAMLLRGPLAVLGVAGPIIGPAIAAGVVIADGHGSVPAVIVWSVYYLAIMVMGGAALYLSARLAGVLDELYAARTELAELAVGRERLRVSRDLHDLLGHSLSAVSLKGDLAMRLLPSDPSAAQAEIESLTGVARSALRDMRAVARDEHVVSLRAELDAAAAVLAAADIETIADASLDDLSPELEAVLAWAVREGATNILRHSTASRCSFTATRRDATVRLEIVNDGVPSGPAGEGRGLDGVAERARALGGSACGGPAGEGRFRLMVEVPS